MKNGKIEKIIDSMTLDDLCGQLLCYIAPIGRYKSRGEDFEEMVKRTKPGGIFVEGVTGEQVKEISEMINKHTKVPVIVAADAEFGPNPVSDAKTILPFAMAWGACDDEKLLEEGGRATAIECRKNGIHWSYAPVVDLNYNKDNPVTNVRAISDSPKQVVKMARAYMRGMQKEGLMGAGCKHFPGDGMDDRNQHFCTTVNSMSKKEWFKTYGYVYKELIKENPASIMVGHICAPAFQKDEYDESKGYLPATLSYNLITKLLKGKLGYKGCVVSDALSMVGISAVVDEKRLPVEFLKAGGDMELFAEESYFDIIKEAVESGEISMERLKDAVRRILNLKDFLGLLDGQEPEIKDDADIKKVAKEIARKSVKIVKDKDGILPLNLKKGDKALICNLTWFDRDNDMLYPSLEYIEKALNERGIETLVLQNTGHRQIEKAYEEFKPDCVLVNSSLSIHDANGSALRLGWDNIMTFWRGLIFRHPKVVFTSLGDPYKLYELPFLKTYVNTFSPSKESQEALVEVLLGEVKPTAKNPVELKGHFKREV